MYLLCTEVDQMPLFTLYSWVGLALGWGVRRFHDGIDMFSNPTEFGQSQHYSISLVVMPLFFFGRIDLKISMAWLVDLSLFSASQNVIRF